MKNYAMYFGLGVVFIAGIIAILAAFDVSPLEALFSADPGESSRAGRLASDIAQYKFLVIGLIIILGILIYLGKRQGVLSRQVVTLNIEENSVNVLVIKGRKVKKWANMPLKAGVMKDGFILQPEAVGDMINSLFEELGASKKRVIVSMTSNHGISRILTLPKIKPAQLKEAIERQTRKEMPVPLEDLYLTWQYIGSKVDQQEFFVLGMPRNLVDAEIRALARSGIKPHIMYLKPLALGRMANSRQALVVDLQPNIFGITLLVNGIPVIMRTVTPRKRGASLEENILNLTDEISRTVEFYNRGHREDPIGPAVPAFLTGELSADADTIELVQSGIEYPIASLIPPFEYPPDMPVADYPVNFGLALKKAPAKWWRRRDDSSPTDTDINILPEKYQTQPPPIGAIFSVMALVIAVSGIFPAYQMYTDSKDETARLEAQRDDVTHQIEDIRMALNHQAEIQADIDVTMAAIQAIEQEHQEILSRAGYFTSVLQIVDDALPSDASFKSIAITPDLIKLEGEATSPSTVIDYAKDLEEKGIFAEVNLTTIRETEDTTSFFVTLRNP